MKLLFSHKSLLAVAGIFIGITLFTSCLKDDNRGDTQPDVAGLMALNLAPDKPLIGVSLSGNKLNSTLPYTSFTGGYVGIFPGKRSTSAFDANSGNIFATETYTYEPNKYYSLFVTGARGTYKNIIVNDRLDSLSGMAGKSYIRYINAIPDSSKSLITINDGKDTVISKQVGFSSVSAFVPVNTGEVKIGINNGNSIKATRSITLEERKTYTVLFISDPKDNKIGDSIQIRYIENGTLRLDSTKQNTTREVK